jgi:hypothetical protein
VPDADLALMRRLDELHLEFPFAGSRMLRGVLATEGSKMGRRHVSRRRATLYVPVSTDKRTVSDQELQLRQVAERRGWDVVEVYSDAGISGATGREARPGLDQVLKDASRRKFDIVMAWAIDR